MTIEYKDSKRIVGLESDKTTTEITGYDGGSGIVSSRGGGGGGGAGAVGGDAQGNFNPAGDGGIGKQSDITGTNTYYAGGGGGGRDYDAYANSRVGNGGSGGGGNGQVAGTANTGGGGGGGSGNGGSHVEAGVGGSGVVILQFTTSGTSYSTTGSPTVDTSSVSGKTILKYTGSGTFVLTGGTPDVRYLVVAGGGAGYTSAVEKRATGGGGAGGFRTGTKSSMANATYTVTVGTGGAVSNNGSDSVFSDITSTGGGAGALNSVGNGSSGGSGGGGGEFAASDGSYGNGGSGTTLKYANPSMPTDIQDNSLFVEKDTARRYWFNGTTWLLGKSHISKSGCLIYYNFEQTSGNLTNQATTANGFTDGLGSTGDGTSSGTVGKSNTGKVGSNAWSFDGSSGKTASSNSSDLILTGDTSWVGWIKIDSSTSTGAPTIFSVRGGATNNQIDNALFCGYVSQNTSPIDLIVFHEHDAGTNVSPAVNINTNLSTGVWYHFAVTRDVSEKQYSVYLNGSLLSTHTYNTNPNTTATSLDFELGHAVSDDYFDGMLDEVSLWNRVLTADEISALYNSGYGAVI